MQRGQFTKDGSSEPDHKQILASGAPQKDSAAFAVEREPRVPNSQCQSEAVADQLERVLASSVFKTSRRTSLLLRYIVERTLAGGADLLKERLLGNEVFGRAPDYDTSSDHIVRSTAGEIRKRLAQYYLEPSHELEIRIDLLPGSYVPQFRAVEDRAPVVMQVVAAAAPTAVLPERFPHWIFPALVLAVALSLTAALAIWWISPAQTALDRFWAPCSKLLRRLSSAPVIPDGHGPAPSHRLPLSVFVLPPLANKPGWPPPVPPLWSLSNRPVRRRHDAGARYCADFRQGEDFRTVYSPDSTLADLRQNSAVLIGGIDNFWTMRLTRDLRYGFQIDRAENKIFIEDRRYPGRRDWAVDLDQARSSVTVDYALVARVVHPDTMKPLVIVGGIRDCGTVAAGEVFDRRRLSA